MSTTDITLTSGTASLPLTGRVAVVTGATSGIGAATGERLAQAGANVAVVGRRSERLAALAEGRENVLPVATDVSDPASVQRLADAVHERFGRVDLVVANAGVMLGAPFETADTAEWERMIDVNVRGLLHTGRAFIDDLLAAAREGERADLIHVGSVASHVLFPNWSAYGATKAAVAQLTRNLRAEYGPRGVRVKTIEPGIVTTELGGDMTDPTAIAELEQLRTIKTLAATDIADAIAYAAAAPAHVNVAELVVVPTAQG